MSVCNHTRDYRPNRTPLSPLTIHIMSYYTIPYHIILATRNFLTRILPVPVDITGTIELALELLPTRLHSSVGRASHRYRGGHGFESQLKAQNFFWAFLASVTS